MNIVVFNIVNYKKQYTNDSRNSKVMCRKNIRFYFIFKLKIPHFRLIVHVFIYIKVIIKKIF